MAHGESISYASVAGSEILNTPASGQPLNRFSSVLSFLQFGTMSRSPQSRWVLWNPFSGTSFLHGGRDGFVVVSTDIVLKLPWRFEDDTNGTKHCEMKDSMKHFEYEKICTRSSIQTLIRTSSRASSLQLTTSSFYEC